MVAMKIRSAEAKTKKKRHKNKQNAFHLDERGKRKISHVNTARSRKVPTWDEDIDSDEELPRDLLESSNPPVVSKNLPVRQPDSDRSDIAKESEEESRLRIAKNFLTRLKLKSPGEDVSERLKYETDIEQNRVHYNVADKLGIESFTFLKGHTDSVTCLGVPENDRTKVFTGSKDCSLILWDVTTQKKTLFSGRRKNFNCGGHFEAVLDIAVSPDASIVVSSGCDHVVRVWDIRASTSKCIVALHGHRNIVTGVCMEPRPEQVSRVYSIGQDKSLHLWNLHMQKREEIFFGHTATPTCIDILQKERPVTGGLDSTVRVWKIASDSHLLFDTRREYVDTVSQLNNHRTLSGHQDGSILLWSVSHRKPVCFVEDGHGQGSWITALGSLRYSNTFFSGSDNGMIRTWKIESQRTTSKNVRDTSSTKKNTEILPVSKVQIPVTGVVTQIATSGNGELLFSSIGREHRLGRWKCLKQAKNGLLIARLTGSLNSVNPTVPKDGVF